MFSLPISSCLTRNCNFSATPFWSNSAFMSGKLIGCCNWHILLPIESTSNSRCCIRVYARRKSLKKLRKDGQLQNGISLETTKNGAEESASANLSDGSPSEDSLVKGVQNTANIPSRSAVLQTCTVTSGFIAALGVLIRQVSHIASVEGLPIHDCSAEVSFGVEMWHLELVVGLVVLISSSRYLLLSTWSDFAESTEAANQQVLTSLQPLDYIVVSLLPGVSEELLFRGALLPLFGMDWKSVLVVASIFGFLHLGNGRKYSFVLWATFVGFVYGYATIMSSTIIVPMASHAFNNLVGGLVWRYTSKSSNS